MMEALKLALMLLACSACTPQPIIQPERIILPPPASVWACSTWPQEDELLLPAPAEDVIRWHRVQRARDQMAFDSCKGDLILLRQWARGLGFGRGR